MQPQISWREVKDLAAYKNPPHPVVSVYLNVDGSSFPRPQQYISALNHLTQTGLRHWQAETGPDAQTLKEAREEVNLVQTFVKSEFRRERTRGLAIFSCQSGGLWKVVRLPIQVDSQMRVADEPYTRPLLAALGRYDRFCAVVVDRRKARIFTVFLGDIHEHTGVLVDDVPAKVKTGEWAGLRANKILHHVEDHVHRHLKNVADKLLEFFKRHEYDRLIIGAHADFIPRFVEHLHPYLVERIAGTFHADPETPPSRILEECLVIDEGSRHQRQGQIIKRVLDESGPGGRSVVGLQRTVEAMLSDRAYMLVTAPRLDTEAFVCRDGHTFSTKPGKCPRCDSALEKSADVVEDLLQLAVVRGVRVYLTDEHEAFSNNPGLGALLRYPE